MKAIVMASIVALAFTTGFTCSKNAPEQAQPTETTMAPAEVQPTDAAAPAADATTETTAPANQ